MYKTLKILCVFILILTFFSNFYCVKAVSTEDEDLVNNEEIESDSSSENSDTSDEALDALSQIDSVTKVSNINSYEEANLHLNNILSVILIAVGILLILFAIAILIRLKQSN